MLRANKVESRSKFKRPKAETGIMKNHILIVDDDSSVRSSLQKILAEGGYEVTAVADGESAQDKFAKAELLILDLNLPIQDGWDILGNVSAGYPLLPVIVVTGLADQLDERTIPGASAFLEKPIEVPALLKTIEFLLSRTPEQRLAEASRFSEPWQMPSAYAGSSERRPKTASNGFKKFRSHS
jgi:DNA-binding response OmpR family regulator